jgi:hypothetical protein
MKCVIMMPVGQGGFSFFFENGFTQRHNMTFLPDSG